MDFGLTRAVTFADVPEEETRRLACGLGRNVRLRAQDCADWGSFVEAWQDNGK